MTTIKNALSVCTAAAALVIGLQAPSAHAVFTRCDVPMPLSGTNGNVPCPSATALPKRALGFATDFSNPPTGAKYNYGAKLEAGTQIAEAVPIDSNGFVVKRKSDGVSCPFAADPLPIDRNFGTKTCDLKTPGSAVALRIVVN